MLKVYTNNVYDERTSCYDRQLYCTDLVGMDCRADRLQLFKGIRPPNTANEGIRYDTKQSNGEVGVLRNAEYLFIDIAPYSTLTWSGAIDGSNRTVWHLNWEQTSD